MEEVFGDCTKRLMCWSHKYRAYKDHSTYKKLVRVNKKLADEIEHDIREFQWMVCSEEEFCQVYNLMEQKYLDGDYTKQENDLLKLFWDYHRKQWGSDLHTRYWYESANPFHIGTNQGLENKNREIKDNFTFREQLDVSKFFDC